MATVVALGLGAAPEAEAASSVVGSRSTHAGIAEVARVAGAPVVVRPGALHRGSPPRVAWLADNVVHTGDGRSATLPWSRAGARRHHVTLLGHTTDGWLVKSFDGGDTWTLWTVKAGKRHEITSASVSEGETVGFVLSGDHQRFLSLRYDGLDTTSMSVRGLDNTQLDSRDFVDNGDVLAFSGHELVVGTADAQRWDVDAQSLSPLGVDAVGADLRHGLLFVTDPATADSGPTSLDAPGTPAWTAAMAQPVVSPRGGRALSRERPRGSLLTVRSVATGAVRAAFAVRFLASEAPVWENDRSFVFIAAVGGLGDRETLVRCRVDGTCRRVSPIRPRDTISLPAR
ncbi:MAG: hypothetical protein KDB63_19190 [Nocardioidaceae bacterium]|nr:hypothetical protein [Nocardioidaceae bacterium]